MAHPLAKDTNASRLAKLKSMTSQYGGADPAANQLAGVNKYKQEGPEGDVGFGADSDRPSLHGARRIRKPAGGNAVATYKRGGAVKHRASGGDTSDIEQADIDEKLASRRHGGRVKAKHRADGGYAESLSDPKADTSRYAAEEKGRSVPMSQKEMSQPLMSAAQQSLSAGRLGSMATGEGMENKKRGGKVHKRARGGRTKKKGDTHVNIMVGHGGPPQAPPVSAMPMPPPMPKPPMGGPPMGGPPGMPPGAGMPPGMPPGGMMPPPAAMAPGALPPGLMPPRKRGGRVVKKHHHEDAHEDAAQIKSMVKASALKPHGSMRAAGGRIGLTAGAASGEGRLEKAAAERRTGRRQAQEV